MNGNILDRLEELLENAEKSALMENAGFGFPDDRIEIKSVHFGGSERGNIGDVLHPTDYVRNITSAHHQTWIVRPIQEARELVKLHADLLRDLEKLRDMLGSPESQKIASLATSISEKAWAGIRPR